MTGRTFLEKTDTPDARIKIKGDYNVDADK